MWKIGQILKLFTKLKFDFSNLLLPLNNVVLNVDLLATSEFHTVIFVLKFNRPTYFLIFSYSFFIYDKLIIKIQWNFVPVISLILIHEIIWLHSEEKDRGKNHAINDGPFCSILLLFFLFSLEYLLYTTNQRKYNWPNQLPQHSHI